ncbi:hypothetical protein C7P68_09915 [Staphylococcus aureus]|nr:hypothetical protein C7P68_09915 [Staphylococcus aureus]
MGPNTEADEKSAYDNVQVGVWAPTQKLAESQHKIMCKLGCGPQQREFETPISTDNASWRCPNIEAGGKSAYNNVQVGGAPT